MASSIRRSLFTSAMASQKNPQNTLCSNQQPCHVSELNARLKELVKANRLQLARKLFDEMPHRDEVSWANMISGYVNNNDAYEALQLFADMRSRSSLRLDQFVLSLAVKACGLSKSLDFGEILHGCSVKSGLDNSIFVGSSLLDMYAKMEKVEKSCRVFNHMPLRNVVSWTALITGLVHNGFYRDGLLYFAEMWRSEAAIDAYAYAIAVKACADLGALIQGKTIHTQAVKRAMSGGSFVASSLANMYNKCGEFGYGSRLFAGMKERDVVSWTAMIATEDRSVEVFRAMRESGVSGNEYTFAAVVACCASLGRGEWGEQLHAHVVRSGFSGFLSVGNSVLTMYAKCGNMVSASGVFDSMRSRDIVSWSAIIAGYAQGGHGGEAFGYFRRMRREGADPNGFALSSLLSVCGTLSFLDPGKQVHALILRLGFVRKTLVQSSLVNMYSKCGIIRDAAEVFRAAEENDVVTWTAMIGGYAEHGLFRESLNLFEKMPEFGLKPDEVTFVGVLTACSHAGLVSLGLKHFDSMVQNYRIAPSREHYGCVVDLLCRAGWLDDAEEVIKTAASVNRDDDVLWSALLRACGVQGDVERGKRAAVEILRMNPSCATSHVTLANIYAAEGRWRESAEMRRAFRGKGVTKEPGWSGVEVGGRVSAFVAGDWSHGDCDGINSVLKRIFSGPELGDEELILELLGVED